MTRNMCWLSIPGTNGDKLLHLQTTPRSPWRPYTDFPQYVIPDYRILGGSKGWATYQKLMQQGWQLIPSARAAAFGTIDAGVGVVNRY